MSSKAETTRLVRAAPGAIWKAWRDLPAWPRWQPVVLEARWLEGTPWAEGSRFVLLRRGPWAFLHILPGGEARRFTGRVLSTAEERLLVWELVPTRAAALGPTLVESVRFDPAPSGTTVTHTLTAYGTLASLLGPLGLGGRLQSQSDETLEALKRLFQPTRGH